MSGGAVSHEPLTLGELARLGAAGVIPGWSDEIVGAIRGLAPGKTVAEAIDEERALLASGRTKAGSGLVELFAGLGTGVGLAKLAAGTGPLATAASKLLGGMNVKGPASVLGATAQGIKAGGAMGAIAGSGAADDGSLVDRLFGGARGAVVGGVLGGATAAGVTGAANRFGPSPLDRADAAQVFGPKGGGRPGINAAREQADVLERAGVTPQSMRAAADAAPGAPLVTADVGGAALQREVRNTDLMANATGPASTHAGKVLIPRSAERGVRRAQSIETATGRTTETFPGYIEKLKAQKTKVDNILFRDARAQAREYVKVNGRFATTPELEALLADPTVTREVRALEAEITQGRNSGRLGADDRFISPYQRNPDGTVGIKDFQDPTTLSLLRQRLQRRAASSLAKNNPGANRNLGANLAAFSGTLGDALEKIPAFAEANAVSSRMHQRIEAAKFGHQSAMRATPGAVEAATAKWANQAPIPLPAAVARELGTTSLPSAMDDFAAGWQTRRVERVLQAPAGAVPAFPQSTDTRALGAPAAGAIRASDNVEQVMRSTENASPTVAGSIGSPERQAAEREAFSGATMGIRDLLRFRGSATGAGLAGIDVARAVGRTVMRPKPDQLEATMQLLLSGGGNRAQLEAATRLLDQVQRQGSSPVRRGLLGALEYSGSGLLTGGGDGLARRW